MADKNERPDEMSDETEADGISDNGQEPTQAPTIESLQEQVTAMQRALKKANREAATRRKKIEEYEQADLERQNAEMDEVERLERAAAEAKKEAEIAQAKARETLIRAAVLTEAGGMKFHNPADAYALIDLSEVEIGDDDEVTGIKEALQALVKERPYLLRPEETPAPDINASKGGKRTKATDESKEAEYRRRFHI